MFFEKIANLNKQGNKICSFQINCKNKCLFITLFSIQLKLICCSCDWRKNVKNYKLYRLWQQVSRVRCSYFNNRHLSFSNSSINCYKVYFVFLLLLTKSLFLICWKMFDSVFNELYFLYACSNFYRIKI